MSKAALAKRTPIWKAAQRKKLAESLAAARELLALVEQLGIQQVGEATRQRQIEEQEKEAKCLLNS